MSTTGWCGLQSAVTLHSPGDNQDLHVAWPCKTFQKQPAVLLLAWGSLQESQKKPRRSWEGAFWPSPFPSSLAMPVSCSLPGWPGLQHTSVPQPGNLVLGEDFPSARASCPSPTSLPMIISGDSFCLIHLMVGAAAHYLSDQMSELRLTHKKKKKWTFILMITFIFFLFYAKFSIGKGKPRPGTVRSCCHSHTSWHNWQDPGFRQGPAGNAVK